MNTTTGAQRTNARQDKIWDAYKKQQSEGGNGRQMTQDDGKTKYTCSPHFCGYTGKTYCQNCGYERAR